MGEKINNNSFTNSLNNIFLNVTMNPGLACMLSKYLQKRVFFAKPNFVC